MMIGTAVAALGALPCMEIGLKPPTKGPPIPIPGDGIREALMANGSGGKLYLTTRGSGVKGVRRPPKFAALEIKQSRKSGQ